MAITDKANNIYLCKFENGMEHDLFIDKKKGEIALQSMTDKYFTLDIQDNELY